jgi:ubiquinone/menaquinone biosynthesis C-methylase UbiE
MQKEKIIQTYQKKDVVSTFDKEREEFAYQKYKHKIESDFLVNAIKETNAENKIKILDVACGTGRMLSAVFSQERNIEYTGLDTSKEMTSILLKKAKEKGIDKKIKLKIGDATKMPFKENTFDLVFTYHLLWHLPREEQEKVIKEMMRVVKKEGIIIFDVLNEDFIWEKIKYLFRVEKTEEIYKLNLLKTKQLIGDKKITIEKLNDAPISNNIFYGIFNIVNILRKIIPINFFHMIYFKVKK